MKSRTQSAGRVAELHSEPGPQWGWPWGLQPVAWFLCYALCTQRKLQAQHSGGLVPELTGIIWLLVPWQAQHFLSSSSRPVGFSVVASPPFGAGS